MCKWNVFFIYLFIFLNKRLPAAPLCLKVTSAKLVHNSAAVLDELLATVSLQQTMLAVVGKHLEAGQLTKQPGHFFECPLFVIHSLVATKNHFTAGFLPFVFFLLCGL